MMHTAMRRIEKQLSTDETMQILVEGQYGVLSTMGVNGYPYGIPLNYAYHNGSIYFHCATAGCKLQNIEQSNKVSFCVTADVDIIAEKFSTKYKSVIIFGKACEVFGIEKEEALTALVLKYSKQYLEAGKSYIESAVDKTKVIKIEIDHFTGKGQSN